MQTNIPKKYIYFAFWSSRSPCALHLRPYYYSLPEVLLSESSKHLCTTPVMPKNPKSSSVASSILNLLARLLCDHQPSSIVFHSCSGKRPALIFMHSRKAQSTNPLRTPQTAMPKIISPKWKKSLDKMKSHFITQRPNWVAASERKSLNKMVGYFMAT